MRLSATRHFMAIRAPKRFVEIRLIFSHGFVFQLSEYVTLALVHNICNKEIGLLFFIQPG